MATSDGKPVGAKPKFLRIAANLHDPDGAVAKMRKTIGEGSITCEDAKGYLERMYNKGFIDGHAAQIARHSAAPKCPICESSDPKVKWCSRERMPGYRAHAPSHTSCVTCSDIFHAEGHSAAPESDVEIGELMSREEALRRWPYPKEVAEGHSAAESEAQPQPGGSTPYTLREKDGEWIAHALAFDLMGTGDTRTEAINHLEICLTAQIAFGRKQGLSWRQCFFPAPAEYWKPPYLFMLLPSGEQLDAFKFEGHAQASAQPEEQYKVPDTPETLARWVWFHYVGIPLTEPYDKEYTRLFDRIEALNRKSFVAGLNECRRQISVPQAAPTQPVSLREAIYRTGGLSGPSQHRLGVELGHINPDEPIEPRMTTDEELTVPQAAPAQPCEIPKRQPSESDRFAQWWESTNNGPYFSNKLITPDILRRVSWETWKSAMIVASQLPEPPVETPPAQRPESAPSAQIRETE